MSLQFCFIHTLCCVFIYMACIEQDKSSNKESIYTTLISTLFHPGIRVDIQLE